jgi:hypothetical protein
VLDLIFSLKNTLSVTVYGTVTVVCIETVLKRRIELRMGAQEDIFCCIKTW